MCKNTRGDNLNIHISCNLDKLCETIVTETSCEQNGIMTIINGILNSLICLSSFFFKLLTTKIKKNYYSSYINSSLNISFLITLR